MHEEIARHLLSQKHYGFQLNTLFLTEIFNDFHWKICVFHRKPKMFFVLSGFMIFWFSFQDFSVDLHSIHLIFFLFERASKAAGAHRLPFFNLTSILVQKRHIFENTPTFFVFSSIFLRHWRFFEFFSYIKWHN